MLAIYLWGHNFNQFIQKTKLSNFLMKVATTFLDTGLQSLQEEQQKSRDKSLVSVTFKSSLLIRLGVIAKKQLLLFIIVMALQNYQSALKDYLSAANGVLWVLEAILIET